MKVLFCILCSHPGRAVFLLNCLGDPGVSLPLTGSAPAQLTISFVVWLIFFKKMFLFFEKIIQTYSRMFQQYKGLTVGMKLQSSLVVQWVKDLALSLQQLSCLLWNGFNPWPRNFQLPHALAVAKKKKQKRCSLILGRAPCLPSLHPQSNHC